MQGSDSSRESKKTAVLSKPRKFSKLSRRRTVKPTPMTRAAAKMTLPAAVKSTRICIKLFIRRAKS